MKILSLVALDCLIAVPAVPDSKLTPAELVTKHLESIGSVEARARVKGTKIEGTAVVTLSSAAKGRSMGR